MCRACFSFRFCLMLRVRGKTSVRKASLCSPARKRDQEHGHPHGKDAAFPLYMHGRYKQINTEADH